MHFRAVGPPGYFTGCAFLGRAGYGNRTFHPIIEHLKRVFGCQPEETAQQHLAKLEAGLDGFKTLPLSESVRLFADLMSVPEDRYPRLSMTAQQERNATLDAIIAWLIELAERARC